MKLLLKMAVGKGHTCDPIVEMTGIAAVNEHRPNEQRSCMAKTLLVVMVNAFHYKQPKLKSNPISR